MTASGPSAGVFDGREHVLAVRVYYEDTDFTGRVYHASYVRFFERGRSDLLRLAGVDQVAMAVRDTAFAVVKLNVAFKAAANIDDALDVRTRFEAIRGARIVITQQVWRADVLVATANVEVACIDAAGRAKRPPTSLIEALRPYVNEGHA